MSTKVAEAIGTTIEELQDVIEYDDTQKQEVEYKVKENNDIKYLVANKRPNVVLRTINLFFKRIIDIIGAIVGIIFLIPITIGVYIANKVLKDDGPVFYCHKRIGKNGKYFNMYKFRTMVVDSDERLAKLLEEDEEARKEWEENRKLKNDPRITKMGKILRKTSLDEFPQFINVLKGEMSIVGPRAVVDGEIEKFGLLKDKVLSVKPGITGNWAANGRSDTNYDERIVMEASYVDKFSIWTDIKILFKTVISVIKKEGAC